MRKNCGNCQNHTWGNEWWNCTPECLRCRYTKEQGEEVPSNWKPLPKTIADYIRNMTDEELADFIMNVARDGWTRWVITSPKEWLKQPAEGE